jgi:hypothetical protein
MLENRTGSMVSLARATIMGLDPNALKTEINTATLKLLCQTIIELGSQDNPTAKALQSAHSTFVQSKTKGIER